MVLTALKKTVLSSAFSSFQALRLQKICPSSWGGRGVIFMMHRVLPNLHHKKFAPQKYLAITPEFLEKTLDQLQNLNIDILSTEQAYHRIASKNPRKFAVFSFDDGYQDILRYAYPIFKKKSVPLTLYIPSSWPEGNGLLYWSIIETIIAQNDHIENPIPDFPKHLICNTAAQKQAVYEILTGYFEQQKDLHNNAYLKTILKTYQFDTRKFCLQEILSWDQIRHLNQDDLVTIGAHSVTHRDFKSLSDQELSLELKQSRLKIEQELQQPCRHLAYPFGDIKSVGKRELQAAKDAGYLTAVTTRKGVVQSEHQNQLMALPRIHLHHNYQSKGYISMVTSGMPFFILNKFRHHVAS